jgi:hypothetical protein
MAQEGKPPESGSTDAPADVAPPKDAGDAPPSSLSADAQKDQQVEDAKARVAAAKEAAQKAAAPAAPKAPVKKKDEGPKPIDAGNHPLVKKLKEQFGEVVLEASEFLGQLSIVVNAAQIVEVCESLRDDAETPFNYLSDLTCVHYPDNKAAPFEVVYQLYSISKNERVRLKIDASENGVASVTGCGLRRIGSSAKFTTCSA